MSNRGVLTVVTKSHLAYARALARSLAEHNSDLPLYVLLADEPEECFDPNREPYCLIPLDDLADPELVRRMAFYYTPFEFCNALKAALHRYALEQTRLDEWIYLDSDVMVCGSLAPAFDELQSTSVLLDLHQRKPHEAADVHPQETEVLGRGIYNGGFLGLRRTPTGKQFVAWFCDRLSRFAFSRERLFVDQLWLNLVPAFFSDAAVCTNPGANLGHWNLWERELTCDSAQRYLVNGQPLMWVHFSGWSPEAPGTVSKYAPMYHRMRLPFWESLGIAYRDLLNACGHSETSRWPYSFGRFTSGEPITPHMRWHYYLQLKDGSAPEGCPFNQADGFRRACAPRFGRLRSYLPESWKRTLRSVRDQMSGVLRSPAR